MTAFDRSRTISYSSSIVTMAVSWIPVRHSQGPPLPGSHGVQGRGREGGEGGGRGGEGKGRKPGRETRAKPGTALVH